MLLNVDRASRLIDEEGLDALLATTLENVYYLSGLRSLVQVMFPMNSQVYALASREKLSQPIVIVPMGDADTTLDCFPGVTAITYGFFSRVLAEGVEISSKETRLKELAIDQKPQADALQALTVALEESGLADRTIGFDEKGFNPSYIPQLEKRLPKLKIKPAASLFKQIRMVKTAEEVRRLREAVRITERAMLQSVSTAKEGVTEIELAREFEKALIDQGAQLNFTCVHFGRNIAFVDTSPWDTPLKKGDLFWFDVGCYYEGYASDISRVFALGDPGQRARQLYKAILEGADRGLQIIKAGVKAEDVFHACVAAVREAGIPHFQRNHVGHGIGLATYDPPTLAPGVETILEEGMVLNIEPPYYEIGFGGFNVEDTMVVTKGRPELLTSVSRELEILE